MKQVAIHLRCNVEPMTGLVVKNTHGLECGRIVAATPEGEGQWLVTVEIDENKLTPAAFSSGPISVGSVGVDIK